MPVPEVNRIVNAFIAGREGSQPRCCRCWSRSSIAGSTRLPPKKRRWRRSTRARTFCIAERFGVIEAAQEHGLLAFGNMSDQNELAPDTVVTGPVWNMEPTVDFVINQVQAGAYTALDLKDFSMMGQGGASLAPLHGFETRSIPTCSSDDRQIATGRSRTACSAWTSTRTRPANSVCRKRRRRISNLESVARQL